MKTRNHKHRNSLGNWFMGAITAFGIMTSIASIALSITPLPASAAVAPQPATAANTIQIVMDFSR